MEGYIKLPRSLTEWEWVSEPNTLAVYIHLHFMAEFRDCRYKGHELKRGQLATTVAKLSEQSGLSIQQTKTALNRLKSTNKITIKSTTKFSIITLIEYDCDFENNKQNNNQITNEQQINNKSATNEQQTNNQPTLLQEKINKLNNQNNARARESEVFKSAAENALETGFERFWSSYPKKTAKQNALKAWQKLKPDEDLVKNILSALERFKKTEQWQKDNGQFIPYPATWLNGRRWEDDMCPAKQNTRYSSVDTAEVVQKIKDRYRSGNNGD